MRRDHLIKDVSDASWKKFSKKAKEKGLKLGYYFDELVIHTKK